MAIGYFRAMRILHRAFGHYPASHRLHILVRYLTCPFTRTIDDIPMGARVLEIGAGHSAYARLITEERAREVIAVDPDVRKSVLPSPSPKVKKVAGYDDCIRGTFDAAVIYDATYRMSLEVRRAIFARIFNRLRPGGVFVFKDMDSGHHWKMKWARLQEWLSDTFLHISIGEGFIYQSRHEVEATLRELGFTHFQARPIDRGYPHPHIIYTAEKPSPECWVLGAGSHPAPSEAPLRNTWLRSHDPNSHQHLESLQSVFARGGRDPAPSTQHSAPDSTAQDSGLSTQD